MSRPCAAVLSLAFASLVSAACGHTPLQLPPDPPSMEERGRAELAACRDGALPPWLDDRALADAEQVDRYQTQAFDPSESYAPGTSGTYSAPLPPPRGPDRSAANSRTMAILAERVAFSDRCAARRKGEQLGEAR